VPRLALPDATRRDATKATSLDPQVGQTTPSGQRRAMR
jgi:hypothetical protein